MQCPSCRRDLADDAPIHRVSLSWQQTYSVIRYVCGDCASHLGKWHKWQQPMRCEGCNRPVVHDTNRRPPLHVICGEPCSRAVRAAVARDRRRPEVRMCRTCGKPFASRHANARTCSQACRQRAYRLRKKAARVAVPLIRPAKRP